MFSFECLWRGQERITLKAKAFAVLRTLAEHSGRMVRQCAAVGTGRQAARGTQD